MCSYCGCESIEVIGRFMAEHVEIINATGDLRRAVASADPAALDSARLVVAQLLWPHTGAEEQGLFRVLARQDDFSAHIATLCGEHRELDTRLAALTPGDATAMREFENALRDHIDKEDNGLFPAAAIALDGPDWVEVTASTPADAGTSTHADHTHADHTHGDHAHSHGPDSYDDHHVNSGHAVAHHDY